MLIRVKTIEYNTDAKSGFHDGFATTIRDSEG